MLALGEFSFRPAIIVDCYYRLQITITDSPGISVAAKVYGLPHGARP